MKIVTLPGVFRPISDSWMLADLLREQTLPPEAAVLDLCTGSGVVALSAARRGVRDVTAVDVSRRAVLTVRLNARLNGLRVRALRGELFAPVAGRRFDAIACNPPYVPAASPDLPAAGPARAWDAGLDGRAVLDRVLDEAPDHLRPGGVVLVTHSSILGQEATLRRLEAGGLEADVVARRRGPLGPLMSARVAMLEERGMLRPGQRHEDVLILRGRLPRRVRRAVTAATERDGRAAGRAATPP